MVNVKCHTCEKIFKAPKSNIRRDWGKYCSHRCSALAQHARCSQFGGDNPNWKEGRSFNPYDSYVKKYKKDNPEKIKAYNLISTEIRAGRLERKPCEQCGEFLTDAHHDDYTKPLNIKWLCRKCHIGVHC